MSIPTPGSDSQSLMTSGLEMLQAPQSLKDIVGFVKPYTPPEEPVDIEALMAERALLDQQRMNELLIELGYMNPPRSRIYRQSSWNGYQTTKWIIRT